MTFSNLHWKLRLFLVVFLIWPAVHFLIVRQYKTDPWKLGGWAMYSTLRPQLIWRVQLFDHQNQLIATRGNLSGDAQAAYKMGYVRLRTLGRLADVEYHLSEIAQNFPGASSGTADYSLLHLNCDDKRLSETTDNQIWHDE